MNKIKNWIPASAGMTAPFVDCDTVAKRGRGEVRGNNSGNQVAPFINRGSFGRSRYRRPPHSESADQDRIFISSLSSYSILVPREVEQWAHRYSYSSPSGRMSRRRLRTGTACRQRGQKRELASNWPKEDWGRAPDDFRIRGSLWGLTLRGRCLHQNRCKKSGGMYPFPVSSPGPARWR